MFALNSHCLANNVEFQSVLNLLSKEGSLYENICSINHCKKMNSIVHELFIGDVNFHATFTPLGDLYHFSYYPKDSFKLKSNRYILDMSKYLANNGYINKIYGNCIVGENGLLIEINKNSVSAYNIEHALNRLRKRISSDTNIQMHIPNSNNINLGLYKIPPSNYKKFGKKFNCQDIETKNGFNAYLCSTPQGNIFNISAWPTTSLVSSITYVNCSSQLIELIKTKNNHFEWKDLNNHKSAMSRIANEQTALFVGALGQITILKNNDVVFDAPLIFGTEEYVSGRIKFLKENYSTVTHKEIIKNNNGFLK